MEIIIEWLSNNYEWLFGGIGVAFLTFFIRFFEKKGYLSIKQKQKSKNNSSNIQIGNINKIKDE
ncbi:MAG TPA: hypothetical protein VJ926_00770 [Patescibacteria group bacterium]|nr:hypothetical protein [Patescibacteria group bacterium]